MKSLPGPDSHEAVATSTCRLALLGAVTRASKHFAQSLPNLAFGHCISLPGTFFLSQLSHEPPVQEVPLLLILLKRDKPDTDIRHQTQHRHCLAFTHAKSYYYSNLVAMNHERFREFRNHAEDYSTNDALCSEIVALS